MNGQIRRVFEMIPAEKEQRIRRWAATNAYTLIFIAAFFIVTWVLMFILFMKETAA